MAFSYVYRRLFEVRLLHGYYLDKGEGEPFWNLGSREQEEALRLYDIHQDLLVTPDASTRELMRKQRLIFKRLKSGFVVGIEVTEETENGQILSRPFISFDEELRLRFRVKLRNPWFWNLTQAWLRPTLPGKFYFTNRVANGERDYPSLIRKTPFYLPGKWYEMGDRVRFGPNDDIFEALQKNNTAPDAPNAPWKLEPLNHYYLTDEDRSVIPSRVQYTFPEGAGVTSAIFLLQENGNDVIPEQNFDGPQPLRKAALDFHAVTPGVYQLEVAGDNGFTDSRSVYINDELYLGHIDELHAPVADLENADPSLRKVTSVSRVERQRLSREAQETIGFIEIVHRPGLGDYRLLEDEGHLRMNGAARENPVFEVSFRPRISYWHYIHTKGFSTVTNVLGDVELKNVDGEDRLVSLRPRPFLRARSEVAMTYEVANSNPVITVDRKLPSPEGYALKEVEQRTKIGSEIFLNSI